MVPDSLNESVRKHCKDSGFDRKESSDIIVKTGDRSIFAHKAVLSRAKYFLDIFDNPQVQRADLPSHHLEIRPHGEKGSILEISLLDDPPAATTAVIQHLYGLDYKLFDNFAASGVWLTPHVQVCITAYRYRIYKLAVEAEVDLETILFIDTPSPSELVANDFCIAACIVFEIGSDSMSNLRALFVRYCARHIDVLRVEERFRKLLREAPQLRTALALE